MRYALVVFGFLAIVLLSARPASAVQEDALIVPDPELCTLEPTTRERLDSVIAMEFVPATPLANAGPGTPVSMPEGGTPVSQEVQEAVEASMILNIACINTGDLLLRMSIYSDIGLLRVFGEGVDAISDEDFNTLSTPIALSEDQFTVIYEFGDAVDMGDGRVAIVVVGDDQSQPDPPTPSLFVLVEQDGHWVVDSFESTQD